VIVDSNEAYQHCLCRNLSSQDDFTIAGSGKDGYEAVKLIDVHKPDIVLMNLLGDGVKTASLIKYRSPGTAILAYIDGSEERRIFTAFFCGISGYITKKADPELLCLAIRTVYLGGHLIAPDVAPHFTTIAARIVGDVLKSRGGLRKPGQPADWSDKAVLVKAALGQTAVELHSRGRGLLRKDLPKTVSPAEIQIMGLVGEGFTNSQIAGELHLSVGTIRNYVSAVLQKTGLHDRTQVAVFAIRNGL
jgi:DNA-binding NarL/FixJ family response regulator